MNTEMDIQEQIRTFKLGRYQKHTRSLFPVNGIRKTATSLVIGYHDQNSIEGLRKLTAVCRCLRLGINNYKQFHLANNIMLQPCDEDRPQDKDSINGEGVGSKREYIKKERKKRENLEKDYTVG